MTDRLEGENELTRHLRVILRKANIHELRLAVGVDAAEGRAAGTIVVAARTAADKEVDSLGFRIVKV